MDSRRVVLSCSQSAARLTTGILRQAGVALHLLLARFHLGQEEVEEEEEEEEKKKKKEEEEEQEEEEKEEEKEEEEY